MRYSINFQHKLLKIQQVLMSINNGKHTVKFADHFILTTKEHR